MNKITVIKTPNQITITETTTRPIELGAEQEVHALWMVRTKKAFSVGHRNIQVRGLERLKTTLRKNATGRREFVRALCGLKTAEPMSLHLDGKPVFDYAGADAAHAAR